MLYFYIITSTLFYSFQCKWTANTVHSIADTKERYDWQHTIMILDVISQQPSAVLVKFCLYHSHVIIAFSSLTLLVGCHKEK